METPQGSIGHKDALTPEEIDGKVVDGQTGFVFPDYATWAASVNVDDPAYLGETFALVSEKALERGAARVGEAQHPAELSVPTEEETAAEAGTETGEEAAPAAPAEGEVAPVE